MDWLIAPLRPSESELSEEEPFSDELESDLLPMSSGANMLSPLVLFLLGLAGVDVDGMMEDDADDDGRLSMGSLAGLASGRSFDLT